jgi:hypothetical protein
MGVGELKEAKSEGENERGLSLRGKCGGGGVRGVELISPNMTFVASLDLVGRRLRLLLTIRETLMSLTSFHKIVNTRSRSFSCERLMEWCGRGGGGLRLKQGIIPDRKRGQPNPMPWPHFAMNNHKYMNDASSKGPI